ncbi:MAG: S8 family serine peptidase, partial [Phycisphaerales bacterium]|nr:S8 family serine peptidase [Phycisphaerales bacterium]
MRLHSTFARLAGLAIVAAAGLPAAADLEPLPIVHQEGTLSLRTGALEVAGLENLKDAPAIALDAMRHVIMLDGPMTPERRAALDQAGVIIEEYMPTHAYLVDLSASHGVRDLPFVTWIGAYQDAWKIDPQIGVTPFVTAERQQVQNDGRVRLVVHLFAGEDLASVAQSIADQGGFVATNNFEGVHETLDVEIDFASVRALASIPAVQYVETYPELTFRNATVRWVVQTNVSGSTPLYDNGVTGTGQLIGHMDGRIGRNHCSFADPEGDLPGDDHRKIQAYNTSNGYDFHGTHTAGTAAGNPTDGSFGDTRGVAYDAR